MTDHIQPSVQLDAAPRKEEAVAAAKGGRGPAAPFEEWLREARTKLSALTRAVLQCNHCVNQASLDAVLREETALLAHLSSPAPPAERVQPLDTQRAGVVVSQYLIPVGDPRDGSDISICLARQRDGRALWAVRQRGDCLSKSGEWEYEPSPSGRDDEFLSRCRFDSLDSAIAAAQAHVPPPETAEQQEGGADRPRSGP
jgi:hypothetical protein